MSQAIHDFIKTLPIETTREQLDTISAALTRLERLSFALANPDLAGREWWRRHSRPESQSWDFMEPPYKSKYTLQALKDLMLDPPPAKPPAQPV